MMKLKMGDTDTLINEQISHLGFRRKTGQWEKLGLKELTHVKATINKETATFVKKLRDDFRKYWSGPQPQARVLNLTDQAVCTTNAIISVIQVIDYQ
jgi:hypothetical protein